MSLACDLVFFVSSNFDRYSPPSIQAQSILPYILAAMNNTSPPSSPPRPAATDTTAIPAACAASDIITAPQQQPHLLSQLAGQCLKNGPPYMLMADLAEAVGMPPCAFARKVLAEMEAILEREAKSRVNDWMRDPQSLLALSPEVVARLEPHLGGVPLAVLVEDVDNCHRCDLEQGRYSDRIRRIMGNEHELLMLDLLRAAGVSNFLSEAAQRATADTGTKTPDVRLPAGVVTAFGHRINWIDSKACFGDTEEIVVHWENQFVHYHVKYGPGLVIYWMGFAATPLPDRATRGGFSVGNNSRQYKLLPHHQHHVLYVDDQPQLIVVDDFPSLRVGSTGTEKRNDVQLGLT